MYDPMRSRRPEHSWFIPALVAGLVGIFIVVFVLWILFGGWGPPGTVSLGPWGGLLLVLFVLWAAFFVVRVVLLSRRVRGGWQGPGPGRRDPAVMIARARFARGEITREQFDQIMSELERRREPPSGP